MRVDVCEQMGTCMRVKRFVSICTSMSGDSVDLIQIIKFPLHFQKCSMISTLPHPLSQLPCMLNQWFGAEQV